MNFKILLLSLALTLYANLYSNKLTEHRNAYFAFEHAAVLCIECHKKHPAVNAHTLQMLKEASLDWRKKALAIGHKPSTQKATQILTGLNHQDAKIVTQTLKAIYTEFQPIHAKRRSSK